MTLINKFLGNVMAFLNARDNAPLPIPAPPAEAAADAAPEPGAQTAEKEPVLNEQQTGTNPKNVGGSGAPKVTGPAGADTN